MIISTWNVRGWTTDKEGLVKQLLAKSDIVCLTEVWSAEPQNPAWHSHTLLGPPPMGRARRGRVVSVLTSDPRAFRPTTSISEDKFQLLAGSYKGIPVLPAYVSPETPPSIFRHFLALTNRCFQGPGILAGDFNARHTACDDASNRNGTLLHTWAQKHNFRTHRPPAPTCLSRKGTSGVDLVFSRAPTPPSVAVEPPTPHSDHRPVTAGIGTTGLDTPRSISLSTINNQAYRTRVLETYHRIIPTIRQYLMAASSPTSLEINSRHLATATLQPWIRVQRHRPGRFRPGWTHTLDHLAKQRTVLLRSSNQEDLARARDINKQIKRGFRRNLRNLRTRLGRDLELGDPSRDCQIIKRSLALQNQQAVSPTTVDLDAFTAFMTELQPPADCTPLGPTHAFTVPPTFRSTLLLALAKMKKKSPGPDHIRTEMLDLDHSLFADAMQALLQAIGRHAHMTRGMRGGLMTPIYKEKGERSLPTNYRPVTLTLAFRRVISTALTLELERYYKNDHPRQWEFQKGDNTECVIAFAANRLRSSLPRSALLDLKKACDMVSRDILQTMLDERLPSTLSTMVRPFLAPMLLRTEHQKNDGVLQTRAGVPQGDSPSPLLFNVFADSNLDRLNARPSPGIASNFVDDTTLLARNLEALQALLDQSTQWAEDARKKWSPTKSYGIALPGHVHLAGETLQSGDYATYLGISLGPRGVTHHKLLDPLDKDLTMLAALKRITTPWRTTTRHRRAFL